MECCSPVKILFDPLLGDIVRKVADPEMSSFSYHTVRLTHSLVHLHSNKLTVMALLITLLALPHYLIHCRGAPCHAAVCVLLACYSGPSPARPSSHSASPAQCWLGHCHSTRGELALEVGRLRSAKLVAALRFLQQKQV